MQDPSGLISATIISTHFGISSTGDPWNLKLRAVPGLYSFSSHDASAHPSVIWPETSLKDLSEAIT